MGETYGGDRPQRGIMWGETAPNAVLEKAKRIAVMMLIRYF